MRSKALLAAVALGVILAACTTPTSSGGGGGSEDTGGGGGESKTTIGIGDPVRDGSFEFVVHGVDCGKKKVGTDPLTQKAQGQFCLLSVSVRNIKNESQLFDASSQHMFDAQGRKFDADSVASAYLPDSNSFLQEINPGNQVEGQIAFDIPKGVKPVKVELHDSPFSEGVTVSL